MGIVVVLFCVLCLTAASQKAQKPWSEMWSSSTHIKWTEVLADGTTISGVGKLVTSKPHQTIIGKAAAPSRLQLTAFLDRSWRREYTQINFIVDKQSKTTAKVRILSKELSLYGMLESKELEMIGQAKANKRSIVIKSPFRVVFEKRDASPPSLWCLLFSITLLLQHVSLGCCYFSNRPGSANPITEMLLLAKILMHTCLLMTAQEEFWKPIATNSESPLHDGFLMTTFTVCYWFGTIGMIMY